MTNFAETVTEFCLQGHTPPTPEVRASFPESELWAAVERTGTELWLDTGDVNAALELWTREFRALTTNNTLLNKEVQKGIYDQLVPGAAKMLRDAGVDDQRLVLEIAFVLNAVHGLKLVRTFDADVSVELHTDLAHDTEVSYQYGKRFHAICPDRFIVKVPLTPQGLFAARRLIDDGVRVNFTLGFSARENYLIANVARPTWVNVFMGRCNSFVASNELGSGDNVGEKATLASQRALRALSGPPVKQIGASMRSGQQCNDLLGLDVFTIPTKAAQDFLDSQPALDDIRDRTGTDPEVTFRDGIDPRAERIDSLWEVDDALKTAVAKLADRDVATMSGDELVAHLAEHGVRDLFFPLDATEQQLISADGKIPVYKNWCDKVRSGQASWDGLLTVSGLASFAADQAALDERIRSLL